MRAPLSMRSYVYTPHHTSTHELQHPSLECCCCTLPKHTVAERGCGVADYLVGKDAAYGREKLHESADMAGGRREVDQRPVPADSCRHGAAAAPGTRARD